MNEAKIQLSPEELDLVENGDWILTKNTIISKVYLLFGNLAEKMKVKLDCINSPDLTNKTNPKISKGENYNGLPYVILDYPRIFLKEDIFAIRTLFWWANYFSVTLHLKGSYKDLFIERIKENRALLAEKDFYISISGDEWMHELDLKNYLPLSLTDRDTFEDISCRHSFLKISVKFDLNRWNESETLLINAFTNLLQSLGF
jgi:hypothetical protein